MTEYPKESYLKEWRITGDGSTLLARFLNQGSEDTFLTLPYAQVNVVLQQWLEALQEMIAKRTATQAPLLVSELKPHSLPMGVRAGFELDIAPDGSHVLLSFRLGSGLNLRIGMAVNDVCNVARKVLNDLDLYRPNQ